MALPPDTTFEAVLENISRADAPAELIGRIQMMPPGNLPISFEIRYDPNRIVPTHTIRFSRMAGTQMACSNAGEAERAFRDALGRTTSWRIVGKRLDFSDAAGTLLARFEASAQ